VPQYLGRNLLISYLIEKKVKIGKRSWRMTFELRLKRNMATLFTLL
jgi:MOSC domain-containing protein YiiM